MSTRIGHQFPITNPIFYQEVDDLQSRPKVRVIHIPGKVYNG